MHPPEAPTTQNALLEKLLAQFRQKRIARQVTRRRVLDFGCGQEGWTLNSVAETAALAHGVDRSISATKTFTSGATAYPSLEQLPRRDYEVVLALAVFEHIDPFDLIDILATLASFTTADAMIIGTMPTPRSRRLLELLSFRLHLIDPSQIADHKVYYDELWLRTILARTPWELRSYRRFQLGMNSAFELQKR